MDIAACGVNAKAHLAQNGAGHPSSFRYMLLDFCYAKDDQTAVLVKWNAVYSMDVNTPLLCTIECIAMTAKCMVHLTPLFAVLIGCYSRRSLLLRYLQLGV